MTRFGQCQLLIDGFLLIVLFIAQKASSQTLVTPPSRGTRLQPRPIQPLSSSALDHGLSNPFHDVILDNPVAGRRQNEWCQQYWDYNDVRRVDDPNAWLAVCPTLSVPCRGELREVTFDAHSASGSFYLAIWRRDEQAPGVGSGASDGSTQWRLVHAIQVRPRQIGDNLVDLGGASVPVEAGDFVGMHYDDPESMGIVAYGQDQGNGVDGALCFALPWSSSDLLKFGHRVRLSDAPLVIKRQYRLRIAVASVPEPPAVPPAGRHVASSSNATFEVVNSQEYGFPEPSGTLQTVDKPREDPSRGVLTPKAVERKKPSVVPAQDGTQLPQPQPQTTLDQASFAAMLTQFLPFLSGNLGQTQPASPSIEEVGGVDQQVIDTFGVEAWKQLKRITQQAQAQATSEPHQYEIIGVTDPATTTTPAPAPRALTPTPDGDSDVAKQQAAFEALQKLFGNSMTGMNGMHPWIPPFFTPNLFQNQLTPNKHQNRTKEQHKSHPDTKSGKKQGYVIDLEKSMPQESVEEVPLDTASVVDRPIDWDSFDLEKFAKQLKQLTKDGNQVEITTTPKTTTTEATSFPGVVDMSHSMCGASAPSLNGLYQERIAGDDNRIYYVCEHAPTVKVVSSCSTRGSWTLPRIRCPPPTPATPPPSPCGHPPTLPGATAVAEAPTRLRYVCDDTGQLSTTLECDARSRVWRGALVVCPQRKEPRTEKGPFVQEFENIPEVPRNNGDDTMQDGDDDNYELVDRRHPSEPRGHPRPQPHPHPREAPRTNRRLSPPVDPSPPQRRRPQHPPPPPPPQPPPPATPDYPGYPENPLRPISPFAGDGDEATDYGRTPQRHGHTPHEFESSGEEFDSHGHGHGIMPFEGDTHGFRGHRGQHQHQHERPERDRYEPTPRRAHQSRWEPAEHGQQQQYARQQEPHHHHHHQQQQQQHHQQIAVQDNFSGMPAHEPREFPGQGHFPSDLPVPDRTFVDPQQLITSRNPQEAVSQFHRQSQRGMQRFMKHAMTANRHQQAQHQQQQNHHLKMSHILGRPTGRTEVVQPGRKHGVAVPQPVANPFIKNKLYQAHNPFANTYQYNSNGRGRQQTLAGQQTIKYLETPLLPMLHGDLPMEDNFGRRSQGAVQMPRDLAQLRHFEDTGNEQQNTANADQPASEPAVNSQDEQTVSENVDLTNEQAEMQAWVDQMKKPTGFDISGMLNRLRAIKSAELQQHSNQVAESSVERTSDDRKLYHQHQHQHNSLQTQQQQPEIDAMQQTRRQEEVARQRHQQFEQMRQQQTADDLGSMLVQQPPAGSIALQQHNGLQHAGADDAESIAHNQANSQEQLQRLQPAANEVVATTSEESMDKKPMNTQSCLATESCGEPPHARAAVIEKVSFWAQSCPGDFARFRCADGATPRGSLYAYCRYDGTWTKPPECV